MRISGKTVALVVTGSVAAFKAVPLARLLRREGATVVPVLTRGGERFVGGLSLSAVTDEAVRSDMWDPSHPGELHVQLAERADLVLVAPATADFLARMAQGRADDLASALVLSARGPVVVAPAMHPRMWAHPATQRNVARITGDGVLVLGPVHGEVASGEVGLGRMLEPADIASALGRVLSRDLTGLRLLVTAGPTYEDLDPVRFFGNRSTGRMGFAVARQAALRGAEVKLIAGPVDLDTPRGVERVNVRSARELHAAVLAAVDHVDALVMSAAVADFRPRSVTDEKIKRGDTPSVDGIAVELVQNPDILAEVGARRSGNGHKPVLVGFALETGSDESVIAYAQGKLAKKKVDLVVANHASDSLGKEDNRVHFVTAGSVVSYPVSHKMAIADKLLDEVRELWQPGEFA